MRRNPQGLRAAGKARKTNGKGIGKLQRCMFKQGSDGWRPCNGRRMVRALLAWRESRDAPWMPGWKAAFTPVFSTRGFAMKFLLPALTVLLTSTSALAAGHDWSGAYLGGQMGYASGTSRYSSDIDEQLKFSPDGFLGGIYGGYNHQFSNNMVLRMRISALRISRTMASTTTAASAIPKWERRSRCAGMARPGSAQAMPSIGSCRTSRRVFPMGNTSCRSGMRKAAC